MTSILLGDIGGTNSRFALANPAGQPEHIRIIANDTVPDLGTGIANYLRETGASPSRAVLCVASPVGSQDEIALTNRAWHFRRSEFIQRFGLSSLSVVNDFEAIAWALLRLNHIDTKALGPELPETEGVKVALGPGTGLGVAALVPVKGRWHALASEGGHASFGPQTEEEVEPFMRIARAYGRVSAEMVVSGPGLARLMRAFDPDTPHDTPEAVVAAAHAGDLSARAVTTLFVRLLGRFAGGLALTFKAFGGVYVAGGVFSRLGTLVDEEVFRAAFENQAPYQAMLRGIPTWLMRRSEPGLLGCAVLADETAEILR